MQSVLRVGLETASLIGRLPESVLHVGLVLQLGLETAFLIGRTSECVLHVGLV